MNTNITFIYKLIVNITYHEYYISALNVDELLLYVWNIVNFHVHHVQPFNKLILRVQL